MSTITINIMVVNDIGRAPYRFCAARKSLPTVMSITRTVAICSTQPQILPRAVGSMVRTPGRQAVGERADPARPVGKGNLPGLLVGSIEVMVLLSSVVR